MEHSKTPWRIEPATKKDNWRIIAANNQVVSTFSGSMDMDNARRIVACVNACAGLSTDLLEKAALTAAHIEARERLSFCTQQIEAERDQLQSELATERASLFAESQRKQQLEQQVEELVGVLENVLPWVVTQEVACHGLKCREPVCMSCSSDSEEAAEKATYAYEEARAVIQKVRGGE